MSATSIAVIVLVVAIPYMSWLVYAVAKLREPHLPPPGQVNQ